MIDYKAGGATVSSDSDLKITSDRNLSGVLILNYKPAHHSYAFIFELIVRLKIESPQVQFVLFRDAKTSFYNWWRIKKQCAAFQLDKPFKIQFANESGALNLEEYVTIQASLHSLSHQDILQIVYPYSTISRVRLTMNVLLLGAIPLARRRIVVLGTSERLSRAQIVRIDKLDRQLFPPAWHA